MSRPCGRNHAADRAAADHHAEQQPGFVEHLPDMITPTPGAPDQFEPFPARHPWSVYLNQRAGRWDCNVTKYEAEPDGYIRKTWSQLFTHVNRDAALAMGREWVEHDNQPRDRARLPHHIQHGEP